MQTRLTYLLLTVLAFTSAYPVYAFDESKRTTLAGNVHPLAQARYDRGTASAALPTGRLLLLLNRPAEREAALEQYLYDLHTQGSPNFHNWITPAEFGVRFGPADSDIQTVSAWLTGKGFRVARVSKSKTLIEFSGNFGQVAAAFHTQIHRYNINGEMHYANAADPQIPAALAGIVRGISALHDFRAKPQIRISGPGRLDPATGKVTPEFTVTGNGGMFFGISPPDFTTEYNLAPLYANGINGRGRTIGIINDSNLDLTQVNAYLKRFNPAGSPVQVVIDGGDPGVNGDEPEAYLDVEVSGSVAPGAAVYLYIATFDLLDDPLILAAMRAIEDNQADVLSVSFAACEAALGGTRNEIVNSIWQEAAASGQSVFVSAGDSGAAGCDPHSGNAVSAVNGLAVNGLASTPWNVAVGGTDFYYADYAGGAQSAGAQWTSSNGSNGASLKARLAEQVWNDQLGFNAVPMDWIGAGSGGVSMVYTKPAWQAGSGVPGDGRRDLPDLSLFSGDGVNYSAYVICVNPGDCAAEAKGQVPVFLVGGTSAATPAMAGIMALIDQEYGRQGQPNFILYPLAKQVPAAFHDVTLGGNGIPCDQASPNCILGTPDAWGDQFTLSGYAAGPGYDLASGLGSVDAKVLFDNWNSITLLPTATSLQTSAASAKHGTPITLTADVTHSTGSQPPSGSVSLLNISPQPLSQIAGLLPLGANGSASADVNGLPGGTYQLWADYAGDGIYAGSTSPALMLNVTPEPSNTAISAMQMVNPPSPNNSTACFAELGQSATEIASGSSITPQTVWLTVRPTGADSNLGYATGSASFSLDGQTLAAIPLNADGIGAWTTPATASAGAHTVLASYSGDASYNPSQSSFSYKVRKAAVFLSVDPGGICGTGISCAAYSGDTVPVEVYLFGAACVLPTGSVTVNLGSLTQTVTFRQAGSLGPYAAPILTGVAEFPDMQPGTYQLSASYSGDSNYQPASVPTLLDVAVTAATGQRVPTVTAVSESAAILPGNGSASFAAAVTAGAGTGASVAPTGTVTIYANGRGETTISLSPTGSQGASGTSGPLLAADLSLGHNEITAVYSGDSIYQGSVSAPSSLAVTPPGAPDFTMTPAVTQLAVKDGASASTSINMASAYGFSGTVSLSCAASTMDIGCSVSPASISLSGTAIATVRVSTPQVPPCGRRPGPGKPPAGLSNSRLDSVVITAVGNGIVHDARLIVNLHRGSETARLQFKQPSLETCRPEAVHLQ